MYASLHSFVKGPEGRQWDRTDRWTEYKAQLGDTLPTCAVEWPKWAGLEALWWEVLNHRGQSLACMWTEAHSTPAPASVRPPAHPGHFPVARDLPGFLPYTPQSYMLSLL